MIYKFKIKAYFFQPQVPIKGSFFIYNYKNKYNWFFYPNNYFLNTEQFEFEII